RSLHVLPKIVRFEEVFVFHGLAQRGQQHVTQTDTEKRPNLIRRQLSQLRGRRRWWGWCLVGRWRCCGQSRLEVGKSSLAVRSGPKLEGARGTDLVRPVVGQQARRRFRYRVNMVRSRRFVVVRRLDVWWTSGFPQGGRVPQGGVAVEPGGH